MKYNHFRIKGITALFIVLCVIFSMTAPGAVAESHEHKTVKIGYYEDHNFQAGAGEDLVKSGYSFEYLQRLQPYTNWEYEYVYGEFDEMYEALINGDVDILTGLAYREERAELFSYPDTYMGNTIYSLEKKQERTDINSNPQSMQGMKIGALVGPMESALKTFLEENEVNAEVVIFENLTERDDALLSGDVDLVILESSSTSAIKEIEAVMEIGGNEYFACVSKSRPDILEDLNTAQTKLIAGNPRLRNELYDKWFRHNTQTAALTESETAWVANHPQLKIGYYNTYKPYSDTDENGEVTGVIKDLVPEMLNTLNVSEIQPEYVGYNDYHEMLDALNNEEIDVVFPAISEYWTAEQFNFMPTDGVISTYYNLVFKGDNYPSMDNSTIAMRKSNGVVQSFSMLEYHCCEMKYYDTVKDCLNAVLSGEADATFLSGQRTSSVLISDSNYKQLKVAQVPNTVSLGFGVRRNDSATMEFFNHAISLLEPDYAITRTYLYEESLPISTAEFLRQNWWLPTLAILLIIIITSVFFGISLKRNKRHMQELTEANRAKSEFLFSMSHDIRTPMNAILGYSRLMKKELKDPKLVDYQEKIEQSGNVLLNIINNVLDMSHIDSGKVEIAEDVLHIPDIPTGMVNVIGTEAAKKDIKLSYTCNVEHEYIITDRTKLNEIFMNIVSNAVKYTPAGGSVSGI
ncbi:MAG: transporter substrate-binding domain-containing protein, partial [Clostridia bacterium]|nr:transporter substrate-binding domain-containing protein [Clostridia bacterium]